MTYTDILRSFFDSKDRKDLSDYENDIMGNHEIIHAAEFLADKATERIAYLATKYESFLREYTEYFSMLDVVKSSGRKTLDKHIQNELSFINYWLPLFALSQDELFSAEDLLASIETLREMVKIY